ncbi:hypothetical protein D3C80_1529830 [compost metagenome]
MPSAPRRAAPGSSSPVPCRCGKARSWSACGIQRSRRPRRGCPRFPVPPQAPCAQPPATCRRRGLTPKPRRCQSPTDAPSVRPPPGSPGRPGTLPRSCAGSAHRVRHRSASGTPAPRPVLRAGGCVVAWPGRRSTSRHWPQGAGGPGRTADCALRSCRPCRR